MKTLIETINESNKKRIEADDIKGPITIGTYYDGSNALIIGKPFTNENDEQYAIAKDLAKKLGYMLTYSLKDFYNDFDDASEWDYFVLAVIDDDNEARCTVYDVDGVVAYK